MHYKHVFKFHVKEDPTSDASAKQACLAVQSNLDEIADTMETDPDTGDEYSTAPFDYYTIIGALDTKTGIFHYFDNDWRNAAPYFGTLPNMAKHMEVKQEHLLDPDITVNNWDLGEPGITNYNVHPKETVTHLILVDFHM